MTKDRSKGRTIIRWTVYWLLILGVYVTLSFIFGSFEVYLIIPALAMINFVVRLVVGVPFVKVRNHKLKKIFKYFATAVSFAVVLGICGTIMLNGSYYNETYIASLDYSVFEHRSTVSYNSENGVYTVRAENEELKVLQLTDIHLCASLTTIGADRKALDACYELIKKTQPDLIIVTGDVVFVDPLITFNRNNLKAIYQFCMFMNNIGIPWAMVYGNHDTEVVTSYDSKSFEGIFRHFSTQGDCSMLYAETQPAVYGRYNQYLRIENMDGSLNRLIFLIDSNDYVKDSIIIDKYDSVHEDQMEWYSETIDMISREQNAVVKSFVFMHIPFVEFSDAQTALEERERDAVYLFGENGEKTSYPERNSRFFDLILEKKSTEAVFVGHDHLNNMGIKYKGVDLVYSKSIDYIAYPGISQMTEQRGATLITILQDGSYRLEQVDYER